MELFKVLGVAVIGVILANVLKEVKGEYTLYVILGTGMIVLSLCLDGMKQAIDAFYTVADKSGISDNAFSSVVKIVGIGYLTEYSASVCADGGANSVGAKIRLYGKLLIFLTAIPLVSDLIKNLVKFSSLL